MIHGRSRVRQLFGAPLVSWQIDGISAITISRTAWMRIRVCGGGAVRGAPKCRWSKLCLTPFQKPLSAIVGELFRHLRKSLVLVWVAVRSCRSRTMEAAEGCVEGELSDCETRQIDHRDEVRQRQIHNVDLHAWIQHPDLQPGLFELRVTNSGKLLNCKQ